MTMLDQLRIIQFEAVQKAEGSDLLFLIFIVLTSKLIVG